MFVDHQIIRCDLVVGWFDAAGRSVAADVIVVHVVRIVVVGVAVIVVGVVGLCADGAILDCQRSRCAGRVIRYERIVVRC